MPTSADLVLVQLWGPSLPKIRRNSGLGEDITLLKDFVLRATKDITIVVAEDVTLDLVIIDDV